MKGLHFDLQLRHGIIINISLDGGFDMPADYSKLWKLLIDKKINKTQLKELAHISTNAVAKMGKNEPVSLDTLEKICDALSCKIEDIIIFVKNGNNTEE